MIFVFLLWEMLFWSMSLGDLWWSSQTWGLFQKKWKNGLFSVFSKFINNKMKCIIFSNFIYFFKQFPFGQLVLWNVVEKVQRAKTIFFNFIDKKDQQFRRIAPNIEKGFWIKLNHENGHLVFAMKRLYISIKSRDKKNKLIFGHRRKYLDRGNTEIKILIETWNDFKIIFCLWQTLFTWAIIRSQIVVIVDDVNGAQLGTNDDLSLCFGFHVIPANNIKARGLVIMERDFCQCL